MDFFTLYRSGLIVLPNELLQLSIEAQLLLAHLFSLLTLLSLSLSHICKSLKSFYSITIFALSGPESLWSISIEVELYKFNQSISPNDKYKLTKMQLVIYSYIGRIIWLAHCNPIRIKRVESANRCNLTTDRLSQRCKCDSIICIGKCKIGTEIITTTAKIIKTFVITKNDHTAYSFLCYIYLLAEMNGKRRSKQTAISA